MEIIKSLINSENARWPRGLMDIAPDYGSGDWGFESLRGRLFFIYNIN